MRKRVQVLVAAVLVALVAAMVAAAASGAQSADPGISSDSITIGGAFPLTGAASPYGNIARGEEAYFKFVNDRGGVNKRQIKFIFYDSQNTPALTVQFVRQLVEQDHVALIFNNLGTENNEAVQDYLNSNGVPNLFVATGASEFGLNAKKYPKQIGYAPDYVSEGTLYGKFIRAKVPQAKLGVLIQDDAYGADMMKGLNKGLGKAKNKVIDVEKYQITDTDFSSYMAKLKSSGANVFMCFATPSFMIRSLATAAALNWHPTAVFINGVGAPPLYMNIAASRGAKYLTDGAISAGYLMDPSDPKYANNKQVLAYRAIMAKYLPSANANDGFYYYGQSVAWTFTYTLGRAGKNPTRKSIVASALSLNVKDPYGVPGIKITTSKTDRFPISQLQLGRYDGTKYIPFGAVVDSRPAKKK